MPPNFYLTPKSRQHLQRHFGNGTMAGSYFLADTFQTSDCLLAFLENAEPVSITKRTATNSVFLYALTDGRMAGTVGIAKRNSFTADNLSYELRDGFQIGGAANYVIENWNNMRHAVEELQVEGQLLLSELNDWDRNRLTDSDVDCYDRWLENKSYSPDRAEKFRAVAREKLATQGVK
jgi:hypothetical protein